ncbi:hypothetical protein GCM10011459_21090 [Limosilactobacillus caviae]|uniref:Uncharacterized protein n=1 Tax=Limosilactobacillus caviae TaxID=1769424 RepID=A0ABQ2C858_9LACO|nr:hypothetical protein GCM10011459_21090 [Limosilactobacillus caviae]
MSSKNVVLDLDIYINNSDPKIINTDKFLFNSFLSIYTSKIITNAISDNVLGFVKPKDGLISPFTVSRILLVDNFLKKIVTIKVAIVLKYKSILKVVLLPSNGTIGNRRKVYISSL